jgi:hypothetical protein
MDAADEANGDYNVDHAHDDEMQRQGRLSPTSSRRSNGEKGPTMSEGACEKLRSRLEELERI